jgi:hypothetical protein
MLRNLAIGKVVLERTKYMPSALRPLVAAAEAVRRKLGAANRQGAIAKLGRLDHAFKARMSFAFSLP